ncbi:MAG: C40 family peptidase [Clostridiales bacterium]|nr:C40 family peptidase [Clostridiales bacterium]
MDNKLLKISLACVTGAILISTSRSTAMAGEQAVAGFVYDKAGNEVNITLDFKDEISVLSSDDLPIPGFNNIGIADVDTNLLIREKPSESGKILGKMPKNAGCDILEASKDGWTKVKSGKVTGYVKSKYLITGVEASKLALDIANHVATSTTDGLRVRKEPSASESVAVLDFVAKGEQLIVLDPLVVAYGEDNNKWVKVSLDGDDSENGTVGYVAKQYVDLSYELAKAHSTEELQYGSGVSSKRVNLVNFAKKYLGYRYVYGGTSLTNGIDCSGFTQAVYRKYGYSIPRTSRSQANGGTKISQSNLKPGDLVFYGNNSSGYINHVAIYIGNNKVIHASNKRDGIKISNVNYRKPIKCVRYIKD